MNAVMLCPGCGTQNSVSRAFCFECRTSLERGRRVSGIRFSGVMAGRQIITILSSQTKNLVVNNKRCSMRDQMLRPTQRDKGCLPAALSYHPVPLT